jgi:hypothetical protein
MNIRPQKGKSVKRTEQLTDIFLGGNAAHETFSHFRRKEGFVEEKMLNGFILNMNRSKP